MPALLRTYIHTPHIYRLINERETARERESCSLVSVADHIAGFLDQWVMSQLKEELHVSDCVCFRGLMGSLRGLAV